MLSAECEFLKIRKDEEEGRIPTEGILSVVISAAQVTLTKNRMTRLTGEHCPIILCGPPSFRKPLFCRMRHTV
jgi:hypothetical protein